MKTMARKKAIFSKNFCIIVQFIKAREYNNTLNLSILVSKKRQNLETIGIKNLYAIGDGAGVTRGLLQASASGVHVARVICSK